MNSAQQVHRPLVGFAVAVVAGLFSGYVCGGPGILWLSLSAFVLAGVGFCESRGSSRGFLYLACGVLAGAYAVVDHQPVPPPLGLAGLSERPVELIGTVTDDPSISERGGSTFRLRVQAVRQDTDWFPVAADIRVRADACSPAPGYGARWRLTGDYYANSELRGGLAGMLRVHSSDGILLAPPRPSFIGYCYSMRRRAAAVLGTGLEDFAEEVHLIKALLLGYRRAMPTDLYQLFAQTGTLHIFAISGLHVGVMVSILIALLKTGGVARSRWGLFLIPALLLYVVGTGMKASALRAFTMAAVYFSAPLAGRRPDSVSAIALAAVLLLLVHPVQVVDPGFQLSFVVVSGIIMVHTDVAHQFHRIRRPLWTLPLAQLAGPTPGRAFLRAIGLLAVTSLAAWLFSAPLSARFFNTVSPVALIGNLAIIPLTFMIVLSGSLALLCSGFPGAVLTVCTHAGRVFVDLLIAVIRFLGGLPGAYSYVQAPPMGALLFWYTGLVLFFSGRRLRRPALLLMLCSVTWWVLAVNCVPEGLQIVRARRSACAVRLPDAQWIVACEGSGYSFDRASRLLRGQGVQCVDSVAIGGRSPVDRDALNRFCKKFGVRNVYGNVEGPSSHSASPVWGAGGGLKIRLK